MFKSVKTPNAGGKVKAKSVSKWETGEVYTGFLVERTKMNSRYGETDVFVFQNSDEEGNVKEEQSSFILSNTLRGLLDQVQDKQLCRIECLGRPEGSKAIQFDVGIADVFLPAEQTG